MDVFSKFLSRRQVREKTGWSLKYIDDHLPQVKVGRKTFISVAAVENLLSGHATDHVPDRNPLFAGEGSPFALGTLLQLKGGSPHTFGSTGWDAFGKSLTDRLEFHLSRSDRNGLVRDIPSVVEWMKSSDATAFFDKHIPQDGRGKEFVFL